MRTEKPRVRILQAHCEQSADNLESYGEAVERAKWCMQAIEAMLEAEKRRDSARRWRARREVQRCLPSGIYRMSRPPNEVRFVTGMRRNEGVSDALEEAMLVTCRQEDGSITEYPVVEFIMPQVVDGARRGPGAVRVAELR